MTIDGYALGAGGNCDYATLLPINLKSSFVSHFLEMELKMFSPLMNVCQKILGE